MFNTNNMPSSAQNQGQVSKPKAQESYTKSALKKAEELVNVQKRLDLSLIIKDKNLNNISAKFKSIADLLCNEEFISRFDQDLYVSNSSETTWFKLVIRCGKIKAISFLGSIRINWVSIVNKTTEKFDFVVVGYSPGEENVKPATVSVPYSDYTPERITKHFTYLIGETATDTKEIGKLLCFLLSKRINSPSFNELVYVGPIQGWWKTPSGRIMFSPPHLITKEIINQLPESVQMRQYPLAIGASINDDITSLLLPMFSEHPLFQLVLLFRMASWLLYFFAKKGIFLKQILIVKPTDYITVDILNALFNNINYDSSNAISIGPTTKALKFGLGKINDAICLITDPFAADQSRKIEKGCDLILNDANGVIESKIPVNHITVIISKYANLYFSHDICCVLEFGETNTKYTAAHFKNVLKRFDADLIEKIEHECNNDKFIDNFNVHISDIQSNIPNDLPRSKVNTYIMLLTALRTYNDLFTPLFHVDIEKYVHEWLCSQEQETKTLNDIICAEFGKILNSKIADGYFKLVMKEEVTPFDKDNHTLIMDKVERRIYIETAESFSIVRNEMESISDTDSLTTALNSEGYLHTNVHNSKCHRLHIIDSNGNIHSLYSHGIKFNLISPENKQRFNLIDKEMNLFKYDEMPLEDFLPLIKTIDGRFAGKKLIYEAEESNHYFGTGRTGSGKSWALAQLIPMLFMLGHNVIVFDVSGTYTREKLYKTLPREVVDILFHFINVGVGDEQDKIPVNLGSLKSCHSLPDKKKTIFSVIRAATGYLDKGAERVLKQLLSAYLIDKNETVNLNDLYLSFKFNGLKGKNMTELDDSVFDDINETGDFNYFCPSVKFNEPTVNNIAELIGSVLDDINEIGFEDRTWDELFAKYNRIIVINLGNEVGDSTHQLLDMLVASLFNWQMFHDSKFLSIVIDELKDQDFTKGSPLSTIIGQGRKFHTALLGATQDYYNQGSSYFDVMKQANIKSFGRPGKSVDRIAQVLGYSNAIDAGFNTAKAGDVIIESDYYNKELGINEAATIKGRVVDFVDTPFYEKFKEKFGNSHE